MGSLSKDLWEMILMRLPLKSITASKLVCKEWKSVVESPYFRERFMSHHQNSHSSWSLICRDSRKEVVAHYGCETWGLARSLGFYVYSFLDEHFKIDKEKVRVLAYTDVGLILVGFEPSPTYYVANPISRQCVKIPPRPLGHLGQKEQNYHPGLVTRFDEKTNLLLGYKIVLMDTTKIRTTGVLGLLVYSSETGLWSYKTLDSQPLVTSISYLPITLNGTIYWSALSSTLSNESPFLCEILVSHDLYAEESSEHHNRCLRVIQYPDEQCNSWKFSKSCTSSQGVIMYTSIVHVDREFKLRTWRLEESWEWQLISDISPVTTLDYFPLGINPFDANTIYMWNKLFASTNLYKRQFRLHNNLERTTDGRTLHFAGEWDPDKDEGGLYRRFTLRFVLPRWLHPIPSSPS